MDQSIVWNVGSSTLLSQMIFFGTSLMLNRGENGSFAVPLPKAINAWDRNPPYFLKTPLYVSSPFNEIGLFLVQYFPKVGDVVIGVVTSKFSDEYKVKH